MCLQQSQTTIPCGGNLEVFAPKDAINKEAHEACAGSGDERDVDPDNPDGDFHKRLSILS